MSSKSNCIVNVVLSLVVLCTTSRWAADATSFGFLVEPRDTAAVQGEMITLYCTVNHAADSVMWVRDTAVISQNLQIVGLDDASRYSISYDGLAYNLVINGVVPDDAGSYKCVAFSSGTGIMSRAASLDVSAPPVAEYPTITSNVNNEIAIGETVEIICEVEGGSPVPEIELIKGDETLVVASGQVVYVWVTDAGDDGAVIECRAVHPLWSETRSSFIGPFFLVTEPPQIVLAPSSAEIEISGTTSFVCSASSAPRANYRWYINDVEQETNADSSVIIDSTESASLLHLRGTEATRGIVRCAVEAANGDASAEASLVLIITEISTPRPTSAAQPSTPSTEPDSGASAPSTRSTTDDPREESVATTPAPTSQPKQTNAPATPPRETSQPITRQRRETPRPTIVESEATTKGRTDATGDDRSTSASEGRSTNEPIATDSVVDDGIEEEEDRIPGASSFDTIFVITVSTIVSLVAVILIAAIGAFCIVTAKRRRQSRDVMYGGGAGRNNGDVFFRSRYISIVRSWFSPVHRDTQNTLTSFEGPTPDQSPYNTITRKR